MGGLTTGRALSLAELASLAVVVASVLGLAATAVA